MKAEIITIGDEILIGQIIDTNSAWIAQKLQDLNIKVTHMSSISDKAESISKALQEGQERSDLVIVTGGLGPTNDDITKQTAAAYFNTSLVRDEAVYQHVTSFFIARNLPMLRINEQQADVFADGEVLFNAVGTAPGMWISKENTQFVFMPGVPFEMKYLVEQHLLPRLKAMQSDQVIIHENLMIGGIGESYLADRIKDIEAELPSYISLSYLPTFNFIRLRLSAVGTDESQLNTEVQAFKNKIAACLPDNLIADYDTKVEAHLLHLMSERKFSSTVHR